MTTVRVRQYLVIYIEIEIHNNLNWNIGQSLLHVVVLNEVQGKFT
jgi:hypothetical protein